MSDDSIKVETEDLEDRQIQMTVHVAEDRVRSALRSAARRLSKNNKIPGFRPGKAPYDVVARKLGQEVVFEEALDAIGQDIYRSALEEADIDPYAPGSLDEVVTREPLVLRYTVPLSPDVDLGEYAAIRIPYDEPEVSDEAVTEVMEDLRQSQSLIEPAERPAELTDVVVLEVKGELLEPPDGEEAELVDETGISVLVDEETDWPFPGVSAYLVGLEAGQEKEAEYTFDEDYPVESLRGQTARFQFKCVEVKSRIVPEWSDDLAKNLGEFEDMLDLRIKVRERLQDQAKRTSDSEYAQSVIDAAVELAEVSYPPFLLEREIESLMEDLRLRLSGENLSLEDYLSIEGKTPENLIEDLEPQAVERLTKALVLGKIVDLEDFEVGEEEIDAGLDNLVASSGEHAQELRKALNTDANRRHLMMDALTQKAIDHLVAIARGETVERKAQPEPEKGDHPAPETTELQTEEE